MVPLCPLELTPNLCHQRARLWQMAAFRAPTAGQVVVLGQWRLEKYAVAWGNGFASPKSGWRGGCSSYISKQQSRLWSPWASPSLRAVLGLAWRVTWAWGLGLVIGWPWHHTVPRKSRVASSGLLVRIEYFSPCWSWPERMGTSQRANGRSAGLRCI